MATNIPRDSQLIILQQGARIMRARGTEDIRTRGRTPALMHPRFLPLRWRLKIHIGF